MNRAGRAAIAIVLAMCAAAAVSAAPARRATRRHPSEAATARRFAKIKGDPLQLRAFLREMPKGGDLHIHLSGAVYAESYLRWAADDQLCVAVATMSIVTGPCDAATGTPAASAVLRNAALYNAAIDAMSMRDWPAGANGHDHFFAAFGKFGPESLKFGDMIAEVAAVAGEEHISYLELMLTPDGGTSGDFGHNAGWDPNLPRLRERLLAAGLRDAVVSESKKRLDAAEARERDLLQCGPARGHVGCTVTIRYIVQAGRAGQKEEVFAQLLGGFELASTDPRVVSVNLVQPEDDPNAIRDFLTQIVMLDFLHGQYPDVPITLHAGELVSGLVPPEALRSHIRESVHMGHAQRIGHGVDVMGEDNPDEILHEMAAKKVAVEIALSSNDQILGVRGKRHPLKTYLRYDVPVTIATDDMGVARSSHTNEFAKAVEEQGLDYSTLKRIVHNSLDYAFADAATKARLTADLDDAFREFESKWR